MKDYKEDEFLMLSGIQHFEFCRRQWALIHIEQQWAENLRTVEGNIMHNRAHDGPTLESRGNIIISREMPVFSHKLGINGICDIVEFHKLDENMTNGVSIFGKPGKYHVVPVEYKRGEPKVNNADRLQLTAQIMCLEEMFCTEIKAGYLYYGTIRHREKIEIDAGLRQSVEKNCTEMHDMYAKGYTPKVKISKSCNACSLKNICLPKLCKNQSVEQYIAKKIGEESL